MPHLRGRLGWAFALLLCGRGPAAAAGGPPIVAVFDLQARGAPPSEATLAALTDLLVASLAATGRYKIVARSQIKERLTRLKLESYRECYDQVCQIELGRELAASKSLAGRVVHLGTKCVLTLELYDLRDATTELAHSESGECDEATLFGALGRGVKALSDRTARKSAAEPAKARVPPRRVTVRIGSTPSGSDVLLDGLRRGVTPLPIDLDQGRKYTLTVRREDHADVTRDFVADEQLSLAVPLALTPEGRLAAATATEWMGLGFGPGFVNGSRATRLAFDMRLITIKWPGFYWTIFDVNPALPFDDAAQGQASVIFNLGTRGGVPLYLGRRGQHQLLFGLGLYAALVASGGTPPADVRTFFSVSPGVEYSYAALDGHVPLGVGVRGQFPVARDFGLDHYPCQLLFTFNVGFALRPSGGRMRPTP
jgi:hypothetical protein